MTVEQWATVQQPIPIKSYRWLVSVSWKRNVSVHRHFKRLVSSYFTKQREQHGGIGASLSLNGTYCGWASSPTPAWRGGVQSPLSLRLLSNLSSSTSSSVSINSLLLSSSSFSSSSSHASPCAAEGPHAPSLLLRYCSRSPAPLHAAHSQ